MKFTAATIAVLAVAVSALPTDVHYEAPKGKLRGPCTNSQQTLTDLLFLTGGWESIDYPKGTGANLHEYPKGTGENLHEYPPPTGGWESVDYTKGGAAALAKCPEAPKMAGSPFTFTSYYEVKAVPGEVVNGTTPTGGLAGASGLFKIGINSESNLICYNIEIYNFRGEYQSPALTATHIHEAAKGASGPPRIAFPNPVDMGNGVRRSLGCLQGPFKTGVMANGKDTADGFHISQIEKNPAGFFADTHSSLAVPGAVRGQLA
ncbi:unnamed protein product [Aureobasidium vineae]|uniref:CHRD domain-containing protein n=1 Tax=Aureobasidium vineae TaxID=2773715 RepID=A0A9N8J8D8_9PEZI|nr:unnamed protein product [Aureobasidium vineae]